MKFALNANEALGELSMQGYQQMWEEDFADLDYHVLEAAFRKTLRACKFFPKVADIREHVDRANSAGLELEAASAWDRYLTHIRKFFHPDLGWNRRAPRLDAITEHSAQAAGGPHWVECCSESDLQWARKRFVEAYKLAHETSQVENLLTRGEAKSILARLASEPPRALPAPEGAQPKPISGAEQKALDEAASREWEKFAETIKASRPAPTPLSEEEWNRRRDEQLARLRAHLVAHPELCTTAPKHEDQPVASAAESV